MNKKLLYNRNRSIYGIYNHNLYLNKLNNFNYSKSPPISQTGILFEIIGRGGNKNKNKKSNISNFKKDNNNKGNNQTYIGRHLHMPNNIKDKDIGDKIYKKLYDYFNTPINISYLNTQTIKYPTTVQFFIGPNISYSGKNIKKYISDDNINKIKELVKNKNIKLFIHSTYLSQLTKIQKITSITVSNELKSIKLLGGVGVIIHLGGSNISEYTSKGKIKRKLSYKEAENNCIQSVINIIKMYIKNNPKDKNPPKLYLETPSGKGSEIAYKIEDLAKILKKIKNRLPKKYKNMVQICLDTCHIFSAGYDLRNYNNTMKTISNIDKLIGFNNIGIIHLNDSAYEFNSRKDCHAKIGCGYIGSKIYNGSLDGFRLIIIIAKKYNIPIVLETPGNKLCNGDDAMVLDNNLLNTNIKNELAAINTIDILESKKVINNDLKKISITNDSNNNDIYYSLINYC